MAYSAPRTWTPGEYPTAAQLNQDLRDNVSFLANPPKCRAYHSTTQSLTTATLTALAFNSERWNTDTMHNTVTNNSRLTCKTAGLYRITAHVQFATNATGERTVHLRVNGLVFIASQGGAPNPTAGNATNITVSDEYPLAVNDYVEVLAFQASGGALNVNASDNVNARNACEFEMTWISQ